jgi:predicted DNA-binding protein
MKRKILQSSINFRCTTDLLERLNSIAHDANRHRSDVIREAVGWLIDCHRDDMTETTEQPAG